MQVQFLLGPAGSGKTFRCLEEIRAALARSPEGLPLILLAPKQATYQLERALLTDPELPGYARLQILSFERLAQFILTQLCVPPPSLLSNEGRVMVLRALLGQKYSELKLFHASARLPGFAQQLSLLLRELQHYQLSPSRLAQLVQKPGLPKALKDKLQDLALLQRAYFDWLSEHRLQDADCLLEFAADALRSHSTFRSGSNFLFEGLWLDAFAQMTPQERSLLTAVVQSTQKATLAFCLDAEAASETSWYSPWAVVRETYSHCRRELEMLPGCKIKIQLLERDVARNRFAGQAILQHIERHWSQPRPFGLRAQGELFDDHWKVSRSAAPSVRVVACANAEVEAAFAAREILRYVREHQGRFRDVAVLVRQLDNYHDPLRRVFSSYGIPFFLDRREPVAHHPLAELTRSALRTIAYDWRQNDGFSALKSGLVNASEEEIDWLENEALARGWEGRAWQSQLAFDGQGDPDKKLEALRQRLITPFNELAQSLKGARLGTELADAVRRFWDALKVSEQLEGWNETQRATFNVQGATAIHATVWEQMQEWLKDLELAFSRESLSLAQWLPIIEAGLSNLTVGVVPPVLDQVLIGSIDRARNPDLKQLFLLGVNEGVFPSAPAAPNLLTDSDRMQLEQHGFAVGPDTRRQMGLENFYGYIACTRAREKVTLTYAAYDTSGRSQNPSSFIAHLKRLFPALQEEHFVRSESLPECEHPSEVIALLLREHNQAGDTPGADSSEVATWPSVAPVLERLIQARRAGQSEALSPDVADKLYGPVLRTSVSRLEQFAACPFRFFVNSGLQAEERQRFELDARERGSFQHEVLKRFHERVRDTHRNWRDLTPIEARELIGQIAAELTAEFRQGLFQMSDQALFSARSLTVALQDFVEVIIRWMTHYAFNPRAVELAFGNEGDPLPAWELDLDGQHRMAFRGKIDRVDVVKDEASGRALGVVIDYKSRRKTLDPILLAHGVQLQLPAYLAALSELAAARDILGATDLVPAGVFYVNLRGWYKPGISRNEVLGEASEARLRAYRHSGRFSVGALAQLDRGHKETPSGQFNYKLTKRASPNRVYPDMLEVAEFGALLDSVAERLRVMGRAIFAGEAKVNPYRKGAETACDQCQYQSICRIDPWSQAYRVLKKSNHT